MWLDHVHRLKDGIFMWLSRPTPDDGAQNVDLLSSAVATMKGRTRDENQDCPLAIHYCSENHGPAITAFLLCDGIGGMRDGGACARLAAAMFASSVVGHRFEKLSARALRSARAANEEVFSRYKEDGGTTFSCLLAQGTDDVCALNIGDSRIYLIDKDKLLQLTVDDTVANQIKELRSGDPVVSNPSFGKQLTQFVGMGPEAHFHTIEKRQDLSSRGGFLLTSDGIHGLTPQILQEITVNAATPLEAVKRLTAVAKWGKAIDNGSAIMVSEFGAIRPRALSDRWERLMIWDSHSRLDIMLDTRAWEKEERRPRSADTKKQKSHRKVSKQRDDRPDLHSGIQQADYSNSNVEELNKTRGERDQTKRSRAKDARIDEPLQLEIVENRDDKPAN